MSSGGAFERVLERVLNAFSNAFCALTWLVFTALVGAHFGPSGLAFGAHFAKHLFG